MRKIREFYVRTDAERDQLIAGLLLRGAWSIPVRVINDPWISLPAVLTEGNLFEGALNVGRVLASIRPTAEVSIGEELFAAMQGTITREKVEEMFSATSEQLGAAAADAANKKR